MRHELGFPEPGHRYGSQRHHVLSEGLKKKLWLVPIIPGYFSAFAFLSLALSEGIALGVGYRIWVACGVALTAVSACIFFNEPLTPLMAVGILLIGAGVLVGRNRRGSHTLNAEATREDWAAPTTSATNGIPGKSIQVVGRLRHTAL